MLTRLRRLGGHAKLIARTARDRAALTAVDWFRAAQQWTAGLPRLQPTTPDTPGELERYFDAWPHRAGIWKWRHYFPIYERHLAKFRNRSPHVLEVGIYSGGSLDLWHHYFGPGTTVTGVDIEPACRSYERPGVRVLIGDQADAAFWQANPVTPDIVIDDGGHLSMQQRVTAEQLIPRLPAGGVYICEDIHGQGNEFAAWVAGLCDALNAAEVMQANEANPDRRIAVAATPFQSRVHSVHCYPFCVVVEVNQHPPAEFLCPKRGSQWQPFL